MNRTSSNTPKSQQADFHGAAIIDAKGREVPITEAMVQKACQYLEGYNHRSVSQPARV